jgi:hypothetical protein
MIVAFTVALVITAAILFTFGIRASDIPAPIPESPTRHLEDRKLRVYENLRDLQFEYRVGKLSDEDYRRTKLELQSDLSMVIQEISKLKQTEVPPPSMVCSHCQTKFTTCMKFCGNCGKAMS